MKAKVNLIKKNPRKLPLIGMRGLVVFPGTTNQFDIGRARSIAAVEQAIKEGGSVFLVTQRSMADEELTREQLYDYGVVAKIRQVFRISEDYVKILVDADYRARLVSIDSTDPCYTCSITKAPTRGISAADAPRAEALVRAIRGQLDSYFEHFPKLSKDIILTSISEKDPAVFVEFLTYNLPLDYEDKQSVLSATGVLKRLTLFYSLIVTENELLEYENELSEKVKSSINKGQREYFLREQQRVISEELGDSDDTTAEADEYEKKIKALPIEAVYREKLLKEAARLRRMQAFTQEASVIRTYLDVVLELPWGVLTEDNLDLKAAAVKLDADHYGLKKVKERIIELLAVRSVTDKVNSQIICLVGPPGVGKTSIARSIAECMGRKYVRLSLGGVKDESEIRGHRRTYVGSMPGRIINAILTAKSQNPLILLDEIDKLGNDYKGDPSSALLEVLDPEQNFDFKDHFIEIPFDLSKVLFITTANNPAAIPEPLYDRMEIIELSSYTRGEKFHIAKRHLLKKQMEKHALTSKTFSITDRAIYALIDEYTGEAGVRSLEREIAKLCRKAVSRIVSGEGEKIEITRDKLEGYLGAPTNRTPLYSRNDRVGVCNGLAWTAHGGEMLPVEVAVCPGSGKLELTGQLGEVMKESAGIAVTIVRRLAEKYGISPDFIKNTDIHIHAPEGAVKKEGPSAGVTLVTALISALSGYPVKHNVAMTGEVDLYGDVLCIGGLKEKLIAAVKAGITTVLIPKDNAVDLAEIDDEVKSKLEIVPVSSVTRVLDAALNKSVKREKLVAEVRNVKAEQTAIPF